jgi:predicted transposase/invertase (TIGR01784 family)
MKNEIVSPLYDFAFSQIFGSKENLGTTKAFLKTLLDIPEDDYDKLSIKDPTLKRFLKKKKKGVVDLKLTTKSGRIIHIELQVKKKSNLKSRIMYYAGRLLGDQLKWGNEYEKLHQVISICICDHVLLGDEKAYINEYELRNKKGHSFTDLLKVVILELPKLTEKEDEAVWPWLQFFKCEKLEEFEMLARKHPELREAVSCVKKMSLGEQLRWAMLDYQVWKMDRYGEEEQIRIDKEQRKLEQEQFKLEQEQRKLEQEQHQIDLAEAREKAMTEGKAEGLAKGKAEGLTEGMERSKLEIARKMKVIGRSEPEIAEVTGLSPEAIEQL